MNPRCFPHGLGKWAQTQSVHSYCYKSSSILRNFLISFWNVYEQQTQGVLCKEGMGGKYDSQCASRQICYRLGFFVGLVVFFLSPTLQNVLQWQEGY